MQHAVLMHTRGGACVRLRAGGQAFWRFLLRREPWAGVPAPLAALSVGVFGCGDRGCVRACAFARARRGRGDIGLALAA